MLSFPWKVEPHDDDAFADQLAECWHSIAGEARHLQAQGDRTALLRALVLSAAVAAGEIASPEMARVMLVGRKQALSA